MEKGYYHKSEYVHLWIHLLIKASYQQSEYLFNDKIESLKPGQFITGRNILVKETGIERSKIERILKTFEIEHQIEQQTNNKFRIISILNWDEYQNNEQHNEQPVSSQQAASEQPVSTYKKLKKERIKELKKNSLTPIIPFEEIINHLNLRTEKSYRHNSKKTKEFIQTRWKEGFTLDDFKRVVDNQTIKWKDDGKMREYLRPETLFGTKFESYLNATPNPVQAGLISPSSQRILDWAEKRQQEAENDEKGF